MKFLVIALLLPLAVLVLMGRLTFDAPAQDADEFMVPRPGNWVAVDSSGNGNHGVNQGGPILGLPGRKGTAYSFDRWGSWIQVRSNASLNPERGEFLFSAWVNFTDAPDEGETYDILRKGLARTARGEFKMEIIPGGRVKCSAKDSKGVEAWAIDLERNVADGKWHRIGCAHTGWTWSVIVDGGVTSKTVSFGSISNAMPLSIGSKYGHEDEPRGRIDEVNLVIIRPGRGAASRPVSDVSAQIKTLQAAPPTGSWHLDEPASSDLPR